MSWGIQQAVFCPSFCFHVYFDYSVVLCSFVLIRLCQVFVAALRILTVSCEIFHCDAWTPYLWLAGTVAAACRLQSTRASVVVAHGLSRCGVPFELLHSTWHPSSWPGTEPTSPTLQDGFPTTDHQGNPLILFLDALGLSSLLTSTTEERRITSKDMNS